MENVATKKRLVKRVDLTCNIRCKRGSDLHQKGKKWIIVNR